MNDQLGGCKAPAAEDRVQVPDKVLFYLSCCDKIGDSKATEKGETIKLCVDGIEWNWENEGNLRPLGEKHYALLKEDYIYFPCCYYFLKKFLFFYVIFCGPNVSFMLMVYVYLDCVLSSEALCDGDLLWLLLRGW